MRAALLACAPLLVSAAPAPLGDVVVNITGLRSTKGQVLACLTAAPRAFPDCAKDRAARKLAVPASEAGTLRFTGVPAGTYAIALLHDQNGNGKADMNLFVPREGFGFSRNAPVRLGPPKFAAAAFAVAGGEIDLPIKMRYVF